MADTPIPTRRRRTAIIILFGVAVLWYALDQLSKNWMLENLAEGETVPVLGDFLQWHLVRNPGAAFSLAEGATWLFTILAVVVVGVILWQIRRLGSTWWALFLGLLLGGVAGNLTDRLTREPGFPVGHVIDFILTPWMWLGFNPAIYNVADIGIVGGMCLFVLITVFGVQTDGSPRVRRRADEVSADGGAAAEDRAAGAGGAAEAADAAGAGDAMGDDAAGGAASEPRERDGAP